MILESNMVFHTDQFRQDVLAYIDRDKMTNFAIARMIGMDSTTLRRFLSSETPASLTTVVKLALYADLDLNKYAKTFEEQQAWKDRNLSKKEKYCQDQGVEASID